MTPYSLIDEWTSDLDLESVRAACTSDIQATNGTITESSDSTIRAEFGSRAKVRVWGSLAGDETLPMTLQLNAAATETGTHIRAEFKSNEGWYLFRLQEMEDRFQKQFRVRISGLREATTRRA
jgi:hypothetical protein